MDRDAVPRPGDLPMDRDAVPRPGDLPMDRDAVPRPSDLPMDRDAVPRPGDLPIDRDAVPRPGDLPMDRDAIPRPSNLPVARTPSFGPNLPVSSSERTPSKTPPLGLALELSFSQAPDPQTGSQPLNLEPLRLGDPFEDALALGLPPAPTGPTKAPAPPAKAPAIPSPQVRESNPETRKLPPHKPPPTPPRAGASAPPPLPRTGAAPVDPLAQAKSRLAAKPTLAPLVSSTAETPLQFDHVDAVPPAAVDVRPARPAGAVKTSGAGENLDLGFSLELEGDARAHASAGSVAIPFPNARVASEGLAQAAAAGQDDIPALAPPTSRGASAARALRPVIKKGGVPRWVFFAAGGVALAVAGGFVGLHFLHAAPSPDAVLKPFLPELAKDSLAAYPKAAEMLVKTAANFKDSGANLRIKAAELILTAYAVHGGAPADVTRAEQLLEGAAGQANLAPALGRAKALLAVAKGKPREAETVLADRAAAESHLILGLARLADDKLPSAMDSLRLYVAAKPADMVGHYLFGKALLASTSPDARKEFEAVLAKNPSHVGAMLGLARMEETPERRLAAARAIIDKKLPAGPAELAELHLLIGQSAQALGRTPEAIDAFQRAITSDKRLISGHIALGESLLYEGKYSQALERLKAPGPALELSPAGKFNMGGALIATGNATAGLALIATASKDRADDPRGPFWTGFAAELKTPPDLSAAEQGYRDAIKRDPKYLPASLKLAALLQQQNKAEDSLTVLRAAEESGAPPSVLQLAWGEALIVAKEPGKAEEVFQKALESDPKSMSARLGIAAALEAQGKLAEAKASLESSLKSSPETLGLRERLAQVCLKLGEKDEALARYQEEIQSGHASSALRLAVARLALDLGKLELVQSETKKIFDEFPRNAEAAYLMARVHEARNENGTAIQDYRHATTWGNTPQFALAFGQLLDKLGKQAEAMQSFANALSLPEARMARGRIYYRSGDLESALADFQSASKMTPTDAEPIILQGLCHDKMGNAAKAEEAWRAALRADTSAPEPHYRLGRMELDRAKPAPAIDHFRKAAAKVPEQADWRADLCFQLAQAELLTGAKAAALADFKKYLDIAPPDAPARPEAKQQVARLGGGKK